MESMAIFKMDTAFDIGATPWAGLPDTLAVAHLFSGVWGL